MPAIDDALRMATARLQTAGVEQARLDARLLLSEAIGKSTEELIQYPDAQVDAAGAARYGEMIARRAAREPVSRILGRREFWSMAFAITPDTLDPRADSETLVAAALAQITDRNRALRILDIGTGSGCLLLALLSELPQAQGVGVDISAGALDVARANAQRHAMSARAQFIPCDIRNPGWTRQLDGPFDLVISNPPYIRTGDLAALAPEVTRFDPCAALAGGADGLDFYRIITICLSQLLIPGGLVVLEAGEGQAEILQNLLLQAGFDLCGAERDLGGVIRAISAQNRAGPAIQD